MTTETRITEALRVLGPISIQSLAHGLRLSVPTIRRVILEMQDYNHVAHVATAQPQGGRPRKLWGLVE